MTIQTIIGAALLLTLAACQQAPTEPPAGPTTGAVQTNCRIEVAGKVWLDKPCDYQTADGRLILNNRAAEGEDFVEIDDLSAASTTATWTGGGGAAAAQSPLGELTRQGDCLSNDDARICVPAAALAILGTDPNAPLPPTHCLIKIDGVVRLDANCPVATNAAVTRINSVSGWTPTQAESRGETGAEAAFWNGGGYGEGMGESLGAVVRDGLCWTNARVRICRPATPAWDGAAG